MQNFAVCVGPTEARPAGAQGALELRQRDKVVTTGSIAVGGVLTAQVPIGMDVEVYADGELVGGGGAAPGVLSEGSNGSLHMSTPGCPSSSPTS